MPLRKLKIGTYVTSPSPDGNPYYPIATVNMSTRVFDVVHMFSERGISAVPIIDENGVVVNLYETVDIIVSPSSLLTSLLRFFGPFTHVSRHASSRTDSRPPRSLSVTGSDHGRSPQPAIHGIPRCHNLHRGRLVGNADAADQEAAGAPARRRGGRCERHLFISYVEHV